MKNFFWLIFFTLLFFFNFQIAVAQELPLRQEFVGEVMGETTSSAKIEYQLPYPGLLPDSPIYFLKALRDRIIGFLITDSLKKAEFNLLVADKRLNAGVTLLAKGKDELALSTISKGENYLETAVNQTRLAKDKGQDTKIILERLKLATKKHQEVLKDVKEKIKDNLKARTEKELERVSSFEESVNKLSK